MPAVTAHHDVKDIQHWLASPKRQEFFGLLGVTNIRTFTDPENPARVAVLMDVADLGAALAALQTAAASDVMDHEGYWPTPGCSSWTQASRVPGDSVATCPRRIDVAGHPPRDPRVPCQNSLIAADLAFRTLGRSVIFAYQAAEDLPTRVRRLSVLGSRARPLRYRSTATR
jgi:hypothetical protein